MASMKMSMSLRSSAVRPSVLSKRPAVVVRQGKGGEEGGKSFDKSCYGTLATNANYALLASALAKVIDISANQSKKIMHVMRTGWCCIFSISQASRYQALKAQCKRELNHR